MDIVIITDLYPPEVIGGAEKHASDDAKKLDGLGHNVQVITTGAEAPYKKFSETHRSGIQIFRFRPINIHPPIEYQDVSLWEKVINHVINLWNPHAKRMVQNQLRDLDPDVIHIHNYRGFSGAVFAAAATIDVPVILTLHDYASLHVRSSLFKEGEIIEPGRIMKIYQCYNDKNISDSVDKIVAPSQFIIDKHHEEGIFIDVPAERIPLGIDKGDLDKFDGKMTDSSISRLLYAGQLTHSKGIDILIDAVKQIEDSDLELHVLGKGPKRESLEERARSDDRIEFHGFVSEEELARQYAIADYTVVPSRWYDNSPMVIYESYARQTPVIGANIGGIPELIDEGETGYCFEPEQPNALAEVIETHREDSSRLSKNLEDVDVSLDTHVNRLLDVYESLLDY
ncbi:glycosyltransferase family 4 protein [Natrinema sp. H-ect1]|uniref:glycosyltransferase family 4 protein n=1 Tax=Natrinema sp. H-ect1 TaxID=3242700 RepID=UPI00359E35F9